MSVLSIISAERERYVAYFEAIAANLAAKGTEHARERLISVDNDALAYPYRYLRVDMIAKGADGADKYYEAWLDPAEDMLPSGFPLGPVRIELYPFAWCGAQIAFDRPLPDLAGIEAFLTSWLDVEGARAGPNGAANAIHSASPVETNGELWYLTVDFGTAADDAMFDLIDLIANESQSERIIIASQPRG